MLDFKEQMKLEMIKTFYNIFDDLCFSPLKIFASG